jgi:hypothetical protein
MLAVTTVPDQLAVALGFITGIRQCRRCITEPADPAVDPASHADAGDLVDPRLRRGRPNGPG